MFNKSEIMKDAWDKFKTNNYSTFATALCQAWREAKRYMEIANDPSKVFGKEICVGDVI